MRFRPLQQGFGAEVLDCDLMTVNALANRRELEQAFDQYQLLLFRHDRPIPPERHVEIAAWFGPSIDTSSGREWSTMDNENVAGSIRLPFHSDLTYTDFPVKVISLHAIELPPGGATTSYVSGVQAWDSLSSDRQKLLAGMNVRHVHTSAISYTLPPFQADHPLRLLHPRTGRPVLFVTEWHAERIYELDGEESDIILAELRAHLYASERIYLHRWQLYDLLIWDNLAVQHARTEQANSPMGAGCYNGSRSTKRPTTR